MKLLVGVLIGVVLGAGITALTAKAQFCCAQYGVDLNTQNEMDHAALIQQEYAETIPFPKWSPPSLPCDR